MVKCTSACTLNTDTAVHTSSGLSTTLIILNVCQQIDSIIQTRHSEISFNTSWLENFYEETVLETFGMKCIGILLHEFTSRDCSYEESLYVYCITSQLSHTYVNVVIIRGYDNIWSDKKWFIKFSLLCSELDNGC